MVKIFLLKKTRKSEGTIPLRFRLTDGRKADITYKSDLSASLSDLELFDEFGCVLPRRSIYNHTLAKDIENEKGFINKAYEKMVADGFDKNGIVMKELISEMKAPKSVQREQGKTLLSLFQKYADGAMRDGLIGEDRYRHIMVVYGKLSRHLSIINRSEMLPSEFGNDELMAFREFIYDEYKYVKSHPKLYKGFTKRNLPMSRLGMNTVVSQLKMLQTFFNSLVPEYIDRTPFSSLGKERQKAVMKTLYDEPFFLRKDELLSILKTQKLPKHLEPTRDAFLLQCAFGCRISDFKQLTMDNVDVSEDGIPFIHYLPSKTKMAQDSNIEICTPIIRYALDIVKRTKFDIPEIQFASGRDGYNAKIKILLKQCGITRKVPIFNENTRKNEYVPLHELGSSKLCRKTHVDMMTKVQVNKYASGLHKEGSTAVNRYTSMELKDRFDLMNVAFNQEDYRVDNNLNIIIKDESK